MPSRRYISTALFAPVLLAGAVSALGQTADPTAVPPTPATAAPPARVPVSSNAQGEIYAAPGLTIPNGNLPWALDSWNGQPALVPVHHSAGVASIADAAAEREAAAQPPTGALPAKTSQMLEGAHARTVIHSTAPVFFVHGGDRTENTGDAGRGNPTGWALVPAITAGTHRNLPVPRFNDVQKGTVCAAPVVCMEAEQLQGGWLRLTAAAPLTPGEYALLPVHRQPGTGTVTVVYDFAIDPAAPAAKDAVMARDAAAGKRR